MKKYWLVLILFSAMFFLVPLSSIAPSQAQTYDYYIDGQVIDDTTNNPLIKAAVQVWDAKTGSVYTTWKLITTLKTDSNGRFNIKGTSVIGYAVYAYYDDPNTPGFDYVPAFTSFGPLKQNATITFRLVPATSILFTGQLRFAESTRSSTYFTFNVKDNSSSPSMNVHTFGTYPPCHNFLNLSSQHVIIPISKDIYVEVNTEVIAEKQISKKFIVSDLGNLGLTKGNLLQVNIEKYSLQHNVGTLQSDLNSTEYLLKSIEQTGFYVTVEKQDLTEVRNLIEVAEAKLADSRYDDAYANLREAYVGNTEAGNRLRGFYTEASTSVFALMLFLSLTAGVIAHVFSEHIIRKGLVTILLSGIFIALLYYSYPGFSLVSFTTFLEYLAVSLIVTFLVALLLPIILREQFVSTFSLAKRHLKQRRLRFILTLISIIVLVMSFVSLTSFSTAYGLITKPSYSLSPNPKGLMLREPLGLMGVALVNFLPLDPSLANVIQKDEGILLVAPKAENMPQPVSLGSVISLSNSSEKVPFFGVLGIQSSVEARVTRMNETVLDGRYLRDDDQNSILVSTRMASKLGTTVGERLLIVVGSKRIDVIVVGIIDDDRLSSLKDVDGASVLPRKFYKAEGDPTGSYFLKTCDSDEVIIVPLSFSLQMPGVQISRIDALIRDEGEGLVIARRIALEHDLSVVYSTGNQLYLTALGSYLEARGTSILIPWIIVILSVVITMLNSIFEQRREIAILSSIGLNPTHITGLFIAEAAITGIIGGGIGYLLGVSNYKLMSMLSLIVEVRPKVSAVWSFAAILVSLAAVLVGAAVALRFSAVITPSLLRRWSKEEKTPRSGENWEFQMPLRIREEELDSMFNFVFKRIREYLLSRGLSQFVDRVKWFEEKTPQIHRKGFGFGYIPHQDLLVGGYPFDFIASKDQSEPTYSLKVVFKRFGANEPTYRTISFLRMTLIEWGSLRK